MGKQGTFQLYMHNEKNPETISTNGEFFHCYATLLLREKRSFQNAQMPWILPIDVPMIAVPHGAPKVFPKGETSDVSENEGTQKASRNASKCILSLKKKVWN